MRTIAFILITGITMLTVQPVVHDVYAMTQHHSCCNKSCCKDRAGSDKCFPESCSGCSACGCCFGFYVNKSMLRLQTQPVVRIYGSTNFQKLVSSYFANCFHPPEMV